MKTLKVKFIALLTIVLATGFACNAQEGQWQHHKFNPDSSAKKQTEMMKKELALTTDQVVKVEDVNLKYAKKRQQLMEEMRAQMKASEQDKQKEMESILNKDQMEKYKQIASKHHGKHHSHKGKKSDKNCKPGKNCKGK